MGVVEGLTEFLPVSSTGHLIITSSAFRRPDPTFEVAIQIGAITAILFLYWRRVFAAVRTMFAAAPAAPAAPGTPGATTSTGAPGAGGAPRVNLIWLLVVAALPAAVVGLAFDDLIGELLFNNVTVGCTLIAGGVLLIALEAWEKRRGLTEENALAMEQMSLKQAFQIGLFQTLALVPGTSRAGATIAGAMVLGFKRTASAEFSFLVGLPILYGATLLKLGKDLAVFSDATRVTELAVASVAAFASACVVVGPFVRYLQRHTFVPFGWYRIAAGTALLVLVRTGCLA